MLIEDARRPYQNVIVLNHFGEYVVEMIGHVGNVKGIIDKFEEFLKKEKTWHEG